MQALDGVNNESTLSVEGIVRERSSKNKKLPTGEIEVVPEKIEVLGNCRYNALPFEINHSTDADENIRLKYRYLDLRNPSVKDKIVLRSKIVAELRQRMMDLDFLEITTPILNMFFSGRSQRLPCAFQSTSGQVLRSAPGTSAV